MGRSHCVIGGLVGLGIGYIALGPMDPAGIVASSAIGAGAGLLPDLDEPGSTVSHFGGLGTICVSSIVRTLARGHRKGTHSLLGIGVFGLLFLFLSWLSPHSLACVAGLLAALVARVACSQLRLLHLMRYLVEIIFGSVIGWLALSVSPRTIIAIIVTGMISHCLGDDLTDGGTPWLWPANHRFSMHLFHTGSKTESVIFWVLVGILGWALFVVVGTHTTTLVHELAAQVR
jgi:membrane-bound metal-dependent hydrolase YbcI (DUF457 family)